MHELLVILLIVLLLFGGKKIPEMMKGLGKGVRSFKDGMNEAEAPQYGKEKPGETADGDKEERKQKDA